MNLGIAYASAPATQLAELASDRRLDWAAPPIPPSVSCSIEPPAIGDGRLIRVERPPANSLDIHIVLGQFFEVDRLAGFANGERFG
jgi:hypothetical protein